MNGWIQSLPLIKTGFNLIPHDTFRPLLYIFPSSLMTRKGSDSALFLSNGACLFIFRNENMLPCFFFSKGIGNLEGLQFRVHLLEEADRYGSM